MGNKSLQNRQAKIEKEKEIIRGVNTAIGGINHVYGHAKQTRWGAIGIAAVQVGDIVGRVFGWW